MFYSFVWSIFYLSSFACSSVMPLDQTQTKTKRSWKDLSVALPMSLEHIWNPFWQSLLNRFLTASLLLPFLPRGHTTVSWIIGELPIIVKFIYPSRHIMYHVTCITVQTNKYLINYTSSCNVNRCDMCHMWSVMTYICQPFHIALAGMLIIVPVHRMHTMYWLWLKDLLYAIDVESYFACYYMHVQTICNSFILHIFLHRNW